MIYRTQFPIMRRYDREDLFDRNGRKVPKEILTAQKRVQDCDELTRDQRTWIHPQSKATYILEYPIQVLDREKYLRDAYLECQQALLDI